MSASKVDINTRIKFLRTIAEQKRMIRIAIRNVELQIKEAEHQRAILGMWKRLSSLQKDKQLESWL